MGDTQIVQPRWRDVKVGRVVLFSGGNPNEGRIAVIVEIHDDHRVIVDNPSEDSSKAVSRHSAPLSALALTQLELPIPRAIGHAALKKKWEAAEIESKWEESAFAQKRAKSSKRRNLNDFERFKAMRLRKQRTFLAKKAVAKSKA